VTRRDFAHRAGRMKLTHIYTRCGYLCIENISFLCHRVRHLCQFRQVGGTVLRPLFVEFPTDANTLSIDQQFLVGPAVLVTPVVTAGIVM
jgi:hypothetical protein